MIVSVRLYELMQQAESFSFAVLINIVKCSIAVAPCVHWAEGSVMLEISYLSLLMSYFRLHKLIALGSSYLCLTHVMPPGSCSIMVLLNRTSTPPYIFME
jgi:hypothetical protein